MKSKWVIFRDFMGLEYLLKNALQLFEENKITINKILEVKRLYLQEWNCLEKQLIRKVFATEGNAWRYFDRFKNILTKEQS